MKESKKDLLKEKGTALCGTILGASAVDFQFVCAEGETDVASSAMNKQIQTSGQRGAIVPQNAAPPPPPPPAVSAQSAPQCITEGLIVGANPPPPPPPPSVQSGD